ncbi:MAG: class I SAM-dependent methyltransferase [Alphaproteobacteria bacterium]|nr:class I SAM-dependent methyltransferase [Alphaproteobacteria bacterium]
MSANYSYIVDTLKKELSPGARCLDFGCGAGEIVERGLKAGFDFQGIDAYPEGRAPNYTRLLDSRPHIKERITRIDPGATLPFPDNHFDAVICNQVFEHIPDLRQPLKEIRRVLKPGGFFLALFPTAEAWWEGHTHLYFVHKFKPGSAAQVSYLKFFKKLGLGSGDTSNPEEWAREFGRYMKEYCFYRYQPELQKLWKENFGAAPESREADYITYRLSRHRALKPLAAPSAHPALKPFLTWAARKRGACVLAARKQAA